MTSKIAPSPGVPREILLLKLGEVVLKGLNRNVFEDKLVSNVSRRIRPCGRFQVYTRQSTIYVEPVEETCDLDAAYDACKKVFGIIAIARAVPCAKEKEAIWNDAKADAALAFLPVYDNLERALKQETADEAYKKGVEMTMNQLKTVLEKLGITEIEALGQPFDPALHNAVMHIEDENFGENTVAEVFQAGFRLGDKVVRFAMVKVAN